MKNLTEATDQELINEIKINENEECLKILSERHIPLCNDIYKRYSHRIQGSGASFHDVYDDRYRIIWEAVDSYDPNKDTKFSTWLGHRIRFQCLNTINERNRTVSMEPEQMNYLIDYSTQTGEGYSASPNYNNNQSNENNLKELKEYVYNILAQLKDERVKKIFELRLSEEHGLTWSKIGQIIGTSSITAISLYEKGRKILLEKLKSNDIIDII